MKEKIISLEEFNGTHKAPECTVVEETIILNSEKDDPADGLPKPEFHPEGKTCLTHQVSGVIFLKPQTVTNS